MNNMKPMVSIIVPVYNAEQYLENAIYSVLNQSFKDWELILIDDGSKDKSGLICDKYEKNDKRIRVFHQPNKGVSSARNLGIKNAEGTWIEFLDSDDFLVNDYLDKMLSNTEDVDMVVCTMRNYPDNIVIEVPNLLYSNVEETAKDFELLYNSGFYNSPTTKLYKKSKLESYFPEDMSLGEDLVFNLKYMRKCNGIRLVAEPLYNCRVDTANSLTKKIRFNISEIWEKMLSEINQTFPNKKNVKDAALKRFVETMVYKYLTLSANKNYDCQEKIRIMRIWGNSKLYKREMAKNLSIKYRIIWRLICKKNYFIVYILGLIYNSVIRMI